MKINKSHIRHITKAITYRLLGSVATFLISWIVTGNIIAGFSISGIDFLIKIGLYYFHERIWHKSRFCASESDIK